jgi:hypothetical protein
MSDLLTNADDEVDERPGFLGRVRPFAKIVFALFILWALLGIAQGIWWIICGLRDR